MAKRGRKPKSDNKVYFGKEQEDAVIAYLTETDPIKKNKIFNEKLKYAIFKMVESIIRVYKLYVPDEEYVDTFNDTLSFLLTKFEKYDPSKGTKAYSYFGTVCKNHLFGRLETYSKELKRNQSYDETSSDFVNSIRYSDANAKSSKIASDTVSMLIDKIGVMIESPETYKLKENEVIMGEALKNLLENWDYVLTTNGSKKLNKNAILLFLRDATGFDTKGIRDNMKKYKNVFCQIKSFLIN